MGGVKHHTIFGNTWDNLGQKIAQCWKKTSGGTFELFKKSSCVKEQ